MSACIKDNPAYFGLLGKIAFDVDMKAMGHTQAEADEMWLARVPAPKSETNVIKVDFRRRERVAE